MTVESVGGRVPEFQKHHRMALALEQARVSVGEMAEYLDVTASSVSRWINGKVAPSKQTMRLWALRTGVPLGWLETGQAPTLPSGPDGCAARDSNPEPASNESRLRLVAA